MFSIISNSTKGYWLTFDHKNLNHSPTSERTDQKLELCLDKLQMALKYTVEEDVNITLGDLNVKVRYDSVENIQ